LRGSLSYTLNRNGSGTCGNFCSGRSGFCGRANRSHFANQRRYRHKTLRRLANCPHLIFPGLRARRIRQAASTLSRSLLNQAHGFLRPELTRQQRARNAAERTAEHAHRPARCARYKRRGSLACANDLIYNARLRRSRDRIRRNCIRYAASGPARLYKSRSKPARGISVASLVGVNERLRQLLNSCH
jgi:hypothetical protein